MKLLITGINYAPDSIGIAKYTSEMCEWLALQGHEVHVVTAPPYYPDWIVPSAYRGQGYSGAILHGVSVLRTPLYVPQNPGGAKRLLHLMSFAFFSFPSVLWKALTVRPDVVISIAPALFSAPGSRLAAFICGAKSWLHIQDFEIDAAFELGMLRGGRWRKTALFLEKHLLRSFSRVSTISPQMIKLLEEKSCTSERIYELRNWVDLSFIRHQSGTNVYREMFNFGPMDVLVLYSGNIANKQGIEILPLAAEALSNDDHIKFLIVGDGPGKASLLEQAAGMANIYFLPLQPYENLNELLNAADIHVLPQRPGAADLVLPSKLTGMFASGRPVVTTADAGTGLYDEVDGRGIVVAPGNLDAFVEAIHSLAYDSERRHQLGTSGRKRSEEAFGKEYVLTRFEMELSSLLADEHN